MFTLADLISRLRTQVVAKLEERNGHAKELAKLRESETTDQARVDELRQAKDNLDGEIDQLQSKIAEYEAEQARDDAADRLSREVIATTETTQRDTTVRPAAATVGREERTYRPDTDKGGKGFLLDVSRSALFGDLEARGRLERHMAEERAERGEQVARAVNVAAVSGLVIPQYLVDLYAPQAKNGRPFANACTPHDLPAEGMVAYISKITTGTAVSEQATEGTAVAEQDIDDTLMPISVQTAGGQQTVSRQAVERGVGVDDVVMGDLIRSYHTNLDSKLINQASTGLSAAVAAGNIVAYTDATPTAAELWPKLLDAGSRVEAGLLGFGQADLAVMHSRRWYWMQSQVGTTWPFMNQPGIPVQQGGVNFAELYGSGFRGTLPNGMAVVVDNNVPTNKGTNEDELYVVCSDECHLWEDSNAPMFIRSEEVKAATLQVLFVVYGFFAYTYQRFDLATAKIGGTGLIAPAFA